MSDLNDTSDRLLRLEIKQGLLELGLREHKELITNDLTAIKATLATIEKQTSNWKGVVSGVLITVGVVWAIIQLLLGNIHNFITK